MIIRKKLDCSRNELQAKLIKYKYIKILNKRWLTVNGSERKSEVAPIYRDELEQTDYWCDELDDEILDFSFGCQPWANDCQSDEPMEMFLREFNDREYIFVTEKYAEKYFEDNNINFLDNYTY